MKDESDKHFVRRLEAFSDIVIGFSLAQLGASLVFPKSGAELIEDTNWFWGFIICFAVICSMWYFHHRLFSQYFVPKTLPVVLNFFWLAVVVLLIFLTEAELRLSGDIIATRLHFVAYTLAYAILGVQYVLSLRYFDASTPEIIRRGAQRGAQFSFLWTLPFLIALIGALALPPGPWLAWLITVSFVVIGAASTALSRRYRRRPTVEEATAQAI
jgi:uncharacterized membrane protein